MAWEVRFFAAGHAVDAAAHDASCRFQAEADALTDARMPLHHAPERCVEVFHRETRRRAVYRLRGGRMIALAEPP